MEQFQLLHQKTRRSRSLDSKELQSSLLDYAKLCSDQLEVYTYMKENHIGQSNPNLWLSIAKYYEAERNFHQVLGTLKEARKCPFFKNQEFRQPIEDYQTEMTRRLQNIVKIKQHGRRQIAEHENTSNTQLTYYRRIFKTIGKTVVFVDRDCQENFKLDYLCEQYNKKCSEDRQFELNRITNYRSQKPLSWISQKHNKLFQLANQIIPSASLPSLKQPRSSVQSGLTATNQVLMTPTSKRNRLRNRDSAELLRQTFEKRMGKAPQSPRFKNQHAPLDKQIRFKSGKKQSQLNSYIQDDHIPELPRYAANNGLHNLLELSFKAYVSQKDLTFNKVNAATIEGSLLESQVQANDELLLKDIIKQIQIQKYEFQSQLPRGEGFQVDSQKENKVDATTKQFDRSRLRPALVELKLEDCTDPQVLNIILARQIEIISDDSIGSLQALLEYDSDCINGSRSRINVDKLGFHRPSTEERELITMSQRRQRTSVLSTISEEAPVSEMKYHKL